MSELKFDVDKVISLLKTIKVFDVEYYLDQNEDVRNAQLDPHYHYVVAGEREGRRPCRLFDAEWYGNKYKVDPTVVNLFLHYLVKGERAGYMPSPLFDPGYVFETYRLNEGESALAYFMNRHKAEGINPNPFFDTKEYLAIYPDIIQSTLSPYLHFIDYGIFEGRVPRASFNWAYVRSAYDLQGRNIDVFTAFCTYAKDLNWQCNGRLHIEAIQEEIKKNQQPGEFYEDKPLQVNKMAKADVDIFAFYLPQFHKEPNNDTWWGEGFTEWTNLARGVPRYEGHYQPRVPGVLGYYDLSNSDVLHKQAAMARDAGVSGFGIYYYDFGDKDVLRKPLRVLRENTKIDIKYFLIWANETWSRRWDGSESDILVAQSYPKGFERKLALDFAGYFEDSRYHTIEGRPFLVVYRPGHIPNAKKFIKNLRKECRECGYDPLIFIAQSFGDIDPTVHGADGAMEFPPHKLSSGAQLVNSQKKLYCSSPELRIFNYDNFVNNSLNESEPTYRLIKTAFPSWDNDARKQGNSHVVDGANPKKFENWLRKLIQRELTLRNPSPIVCVNAWNEWGEGAYLEPDRHLGYAHLNAVARSLVFDAQYQKRQVVLVGHDLFNSGAQRLLLETGKEFKHAGWSVHYAIASKAHYNAELLKQYELVGPVRFLSDVAECNNWAEFHTHFREVRPSLYVFNTSVSGPWLNAFPDVEAVPTVLLVHEMTSMLKLYVDYAALSAVVDRFTRVIFPAPVVRKQFEKFMGRKLSNGMVQPQGMYKQPADLVPYENNDENFKAFLGERRSPLVVVGLGYADLRKGFDLFVNTCAELARRDIDVLFVWQGEVHVDFQRWLLVETEYLVQQKKLLIVPPNENIANIMAVADAYFLSSREDPFPSVALEAWYFGVPVFAYKRSGGISDLVEFDPKLGVVLENSSVVEAAAKFEALKASKQDTEQAKSLIAYRQAYVRQVHDFPAYVRQLSEIAGAQADVDVCVLTYNHQDYVGERLKSIVDQTSIRKSITVFDAGSTDDTLEAVRAFNLASASNIKMVQTPKNDGYLPALWNAALEKSSAEFIWLAEGDDSAHPHFLDRGLEILRKDPKVGLVFTGIHRIDGEGRVLETSLQAYIESIMGSKWATGGYFEGQEFLESGATVANPITNISGVLFRREALIEAMSAFDELKGISFAFDWILYVALARNGWKIAYTKEILNFHRMHEKSFSGELDVKDHIKEIKHIYKCLDQIAKIEKEGLREKYIKQLQ